MGELYGSVTKEDIEAEGSRHPHEEVLFYEKGPAAERETPRSDHPFAVVALRMSVCASPSLTVPPPLTDTEIYQAMNRLDRI